MITKLILHCLCAVLGLFLASYLISSVDFVGTVEILLIAGLIMGLVNFFIRPVLKIITLPLKFLTLGLSSLIINIGLVWLIIGVFFKESFIIKGWLGYFWIFLFVWMFNLLLISKKK